MSDETSYESVLESIRTAIKRRDELRDKWAERIVRQIGAARDVGMRDVSVGAHRVAMRIVTARCSQWADGSYSWEHSTNEILIDGRWSFGPLDLAQHQRGPARCDGERVRPAPVSILAEIARDLPAVLTTYTTERLAEVTAQIATAESAR